MPRSLPFRNPLRAAFLAATAVALAACGDAPVASLATSESAVLLADRDAISVTTIDVPGALVTIPQDIGADGAVVGSFRNAQGTHGFLLRHGTYITLDYPGAAVTEARGIASDGTIVGSYRLPGEPAVSFHGFRRTPEGEFVMVDYPGHTSTIPQRILDDGTILGCRHDADQMETMRGVVMSPSGNSETEAFASMHNGATPSGRRIVGLYTNMMVGAGRTEGYVIDDGEFTPFVVPGSTFTTAWDVNPRGDVVGVFRDAAGVFHGYVRTRDGFISIDAPDATATRAFGINASGDVVGTYLDARGATHGFLAQPAR
jgi:probable HAF family extracellular repeat protein